MIFEVTTQDLCPATHTYQALLARVDARLRNAGIFMNEEPMVRIIAEAICHDAATVSWMVARERWYEFQDRVGGSERAT
jgi:hypothetical protein